MELTACLEGFAGIPQDTRISYDLLSRNTAANVAGLVMDNGAGTSGFRYKPSLSRDRQIDQISRYIIAIAEKDQDNEGDLGQRLSKVMTGAGMPWHVLFNLLGLGRDIFDLDADNFSDYLWSTLFAKTLPATAREAVLSSQFLGTAVSAHQAFAAAAMGLPPVVINTSEWDDFISQKPLNARLSDNTRLWVRYHDAIPMTHPHTIKSPRLAQKIHYSALRRNAEHADFVCNSEATRNALLGLYPDIGSRTHVVHCCVPDAFFPDHDIDLENILLNRANTDIIPGVKSLEDLMLLKESLRGSFSPEYFLAVGTMEPRKNYGAVISAWERLRASSSRDIKLVLVANRGWGCGKTEQRIASHFTNGNVYLLKNVPLFELRKLYSNAIATVASGYAEGFGFSGIESMKCGTPVIASNIECHREVYASAATYFDPYTPAELTVRMQELIAVEDKERSERVNVGLTNSERYSESTIAAQWNSAIGLSPAESE
ncbi:glycosyltransferase family 4 protein [Halioglobus maricola]|nr:glycosyltransferase family 1 protein [Halioglobus maricola]